MRGRSHKVLAVPAVVAACGLLAAPAQAIQVSCGQTISQSTKVSNSLRDCAGDGLVIDTDGVVLDLNRRTIDGTGTGSGITIPNGVDDVIVKNGTVKQFNRGADVGNGDANRLISLTVRDSGGQGILVDGGSHTLLRNNGVFDSASAGFDIVTNTGAVIQGNRSQRNQFGFILEAVTNSLVERNLALDSENAGFSTGTAGGNLLRDNVARRSGFVGFGIAGAGNILLRAQASGNGSHGIQVQSDNTKVLRSVSTGNDGDGILVLGSANGALLDGNAANRNGDDGIVVANATATLRRNSAFDNQGFGIDAVAGVTDLGGNRARRNDGGNCVNVSC